MLMSMAYLDQILPVLSTVEAVEVTRRAVLVCQKHYLPTFTVSEKLVAAYICTACVSVLHACFSCKRMRISRAHDTPPRVQHFSAFHCVCDVMIILASACTYVGNGHGKRSIITAWYVYAHKNTLPA